MYVSLANNSKSLQFSDSMVRHSAYEMIAKDIIGVKSSSPSCSGPVLDPRPDGNISPSVSNSKHMSVNSNVKVLLSLNKLADIFHTGIKHPRYNYNV